MSEAQQSSSTEANRGAQEPCFCHAFRRAAEEIASVFAPPENVDKHFRQARIEFLRGIRELIDERINQLSRSKEKGTRVVVE